jgi:integrase
MTECVLLSGWRRGEVLGLEWKQVDTVAGVVRLEAEASKNGEARVLPYRRHSELAALILGQEEARRALLRESGSLTSCVFHRDARRIRSFHAAWRAACERAGVPGRLCHDLRHRGRARGNRRRRSKRGHADHRSQPRAFVGATRSRTRRTSPTRSDNWRPPTYSVYISAPFRTSNAEKTAPRRGRESAKVIA